MFINLGLSYETHFLKKILKTSQGLALNQTYFFLWLNSLRCRGFFFSYDFFVLRPEGTHITYLSKRFDSWYYLKIFFSIQAVCAGFNPSIFLELTRVGFFLSLKIKRKYYLRWKWWKTVGNLGEYLRRYTRLLVFAMSWLNSLSSRRFTV